MYVLLFFSPFITISCDTVYDLQLIQWIIVNFLRGDSIEIKKKEKRQNKRKRSSYFFLEV